MGDVLKKQATKKKRTHGKSKSFPSMTDPEETWIISFFTDLEAWSGFNPEGWTGGQYSGTRKSCTGNWKEREIIRERKR